MALTNRKIKVEIRLGQGTLRGENNTVTLDNLRCSVNIVREGISSARADISIYGLPLDLMNKLTVDYRFYFEQRLNNHVIVWAGDDEKGMAVVFAGTIREAWAEGRQAPDLSFYIGAYSGGYRLLEPLPPVSFKGEVDAAMVLASIVDQMGYMFRNGGVSGTLHNPYKPGSAKAQLESVCSDINCYYDIDDRQETVSVWPRGSHNGAQIVKISKESGLVGYPSFTQSSVRFTTLFNPNLSFFGLIELKSQFGPANGQWVVYQIAHRLESNIPGGQWFSDIEAVYPEVAAYE